MAEFYRKKKKVCYMCTGKDINYKDVETANKKNIRINKLLDIYGYNEILRENLADQEQQKEKEILSVKSRCVHRYEGTFKGLVREEPEE